MDAAASLAPAIPADSKNWTWVLERPCGECGFDARGIDREDVAPPPRHSVSGDV